MTLRTVEDRLREEYFLLSPEIKRVLHQLQTDVGEVLWFLFYELTRPSRNTDRAYAHGSILAGRTRRILQAT